MSGRFFYLPIHYLLKSTGWCWRLPAWAALDLTNGWNFQGHDILHAVLFSLVGRRCSRSSGRFSRRPQWWLASGQRSVFTQVSPGSWRRLFTMGVLIRHQLSSAATWMGKEKKLASISAHFKHLHQSSSFHRGKTKVTSWWVTEDLFLEKVKSWPFCEGLNHHVFF